jgi:hypothetical protein
LNRIRIKNYETNTGEATTEKTAQQPKSLSKENEKASIIFQKHRDLVQKYRGLDMMEEPG